jgi:hypothetical protein
MRFPRFARNDDICPPHPLSPSPQGEGGRKLAGGHPHTPGRKYPAPLGEKGSWGVTPVPCQRETLPRPPWIPAFAGMTERGVGITERGAGRAIGVAGRASKGIRLHDTRHSHASLLLKAGTHPKIVQERLGHASIQITLDTYSHVAPGLQEAAANRFDELVNPTHKKDDAGKVR